jgi:hypothetical protein
MNDDSDKINDLMAKKDQNYKLSKTPVGLMSSLISKNPNNIKSASNLLERNKPKNKSVSPLSKNQGFLKHNHTEKIIKNNNINERNNNSKKIFNPIFNQNNNKKNKEMNYFNYKHRIIKRSKNNKKEEIISSNRISGSNILKEIRHSNYYNRNQNRNNISNNQIYSYKNINANNYRKKKKNSKISLELEFNEDYKGFNKYNKIKNKNDNKSSKRKINSNICFKNNIFNRNNSTININSMRMALNGNININFIIKGSTNTNNLIDKYKKRINNKKMGRSNSAGYFNINYN